MTGPAFEQMLLQADGPVVQAIMSSLVVCARMRGQQKGQVVDLLSQRGLHRTLQGEQCHLMVSTDRLSYLSSEITAVVRLRVNDQDCTSLTHSLAHSLTHSTHTHLLTHTVNSLTHCKECHLTHCMQKRQSRTELLPRASAGRTLRRNQLSSNKSLFWPV